MGGDESVEGVSSSRVVESSFQEGTVVVVVVVVVAEEKRAGLVWVDAIEGVNAVATIVFQCDTAASKMRNEGMVHPMTAILVIVFRSSFTV